MVTRGHDPALWNLVLVVGCTSTPWVAGIVWAWRRRPKDGAVPLSMGDHLRRRLLRP